MPKSAPPSSRRFLWLQRTAVAAVVITMLAGAGVAVQVQRSFPALDGTQVLSGLDAPLTVLRDGADVAHVQAPSPQAAWFGIGYVHAQERSWQLEFNRRLVRGTLSEILGPATLPVDRLMRTLDLAGAARRQLANLPAAAREALQAYSAGIAAYHQHRREALPPEFLLLGTQPGGVEGVPWTPEDSVAWTLVMALDLGGNWGQEFARLAMAETLDTERLWQLMPPYPSEKPATATDLAALYRGLGVYRDRAGEGKPSASKSTTADLHPSDGLAAWALAFAHEAGSSEGKGSNNWVLDGRRTASGKPLLANDPHLGLTAPAIWYFAGLKAPEGRLADGTPLPGFQVVGATLPGLPFVVLGRTDRVAWGFTNTAPDVQDLYLEQIHPEDPSRYRTPEGWAPFEVRQERIRIKGQADEVLAVRSTRHGPVISDAQPDRHGKVLDLRRHVLALRWTALDADNQTVTAALRTNQARSVPELFEALALNHAPMQSVVAADVDGRMGFKAAGRVPLRHPENGLRGVAPAPGWDARYDWQGWLPYDQTPQDDGQARGWIATANQRITAPDYPHFLTQDWVLPYRQQRIEQVLEGTERHDLASMQALQGDVLSLATQVLLPWLKQVQSAHPLAAPVQQGLKDFDGAMEANQMAPLVFSVWVDELTRGLIAPRIGQERFDDHYGKRDFRAGLEGILARQDPWWCGAEGCTAQARDAFDRALERLRRAYGPEPAKWRWGEAHPARSQHRPFGNVPALSGLFDVRVPSDGDNYTVNVGQYQPGDPVAPFANRHAASLRAIYDLADLEQSRFIYQTGQSGLAFSPRYRDMAQAWRSQGYRPLQLQPQRWKHRLELRPEESPENRPQGAKP